MNPLALAAKKKAAEAKAAVKRSTPKRSPELQKAIDAEKKNPKPKIYDEPKGQAKKVAATEARQAAHKAGDSPLARRRAANAAAKPAASSSLLSKAKSGLSKAANVVKSAVGSRLSAATKAVSLPMAARAGAVGAAGLVGYKAGKALNDKFGLSTKLVDAVSKPYNPNADVKKSTFKAPAAKAPEKATPKPTEKAPTKFGEGSASTIKYKGKSLANVDKSQLKGRSLTQYMNEWKKTGKRPK